MNWLIWLAVVLVLFWVLARVLGFVLGAAMNILWIVALLLLVVWLFQKVRANV